MEIIFYMSYMTLLYWALQFHEPIQPITNEFYNDIPVPYYRNIKNRTNLETQANKQYDFLTCNEDIYNGIILDAVEAEVARNIVNNDIKFSKTSYLHSRINLLNDWLEHTKPHSLLKKNINQLLNTTNKTDLIGYSIWMRNHLKNYVERMDEINISFKKSRPWWQSFGWPTQTDACKLAYEEIEHKYNFFDGFGLFLTGNGGGGEALVIDDFLSRVLENQIDTDLKNHNINFVMNYWPEVINLETHDLTIWKDKIKQDIDEYLNFVAVFDLDIVKAIALAREQLVNIDNVYMTKNEITIQEESIRYLEEQGRRYQPHTKFIHTVKNERRFQCYKTGNNCYTLNELLETE